MLDYAPAVVPEEPEPSTGGGGGGGGGGGATRGFDLDEFLAGPTASVAGQGGANGRSGAAASGIPATDADALARWQLGYDRFTRLYQWGLGLAPPATEGEPSRQTLFHNTCEWIRAGEVKVALVSPSPQPRQNATGDNHFDPSLHYPAQTPNIANATPDWDGFWGFYEEGNDTLSLVDVGADKWDDHALIGTMVHEVQHDADGGPGDALYPDTDAEYSDYKSEFRAWWNDPIDGAAMGDPTLPAPTGAIVTATRNGVSKTQAVTGFANARQHGIFLQLTDGYNPANPTVYDYISERFVFDAAFRAMVVAYTTPQGGNLLNSVRVEHLCELITARKPFADVETYARTSLDAADRTFLSDRARAADFWTLAATHLSASMQTRLAAAIASGPAAAPPDRHTTYTVVAGDTLSLIAGRLLGDINRWTELYAIAANRAAIGPDPDVLAVGTPLEIPMT